MKNWKKLLPEKPIKARISRMTLVRDVVLILVSILFAIYLSQAGVANTVIEFFGSQRWIATIIAGMFFTSLFTTAPAIAILGEVAITMPLWLFVLLGGVGAAIGDYVIFKFIKNTIARDAGYLLQFKENKYSKIFKTRLFRTFLFLFGALAIASPLPNELGITILGLSTMSNRMVLILSFILNGIGILAVGLAAHAIAGV